MLTQEPLDSYLDSQEEDDDSKERFDAAFPPCDCEDCPGWYMECNSDCATRCPIEMQADCLCECHREKMKNIGEALTWDELAIMYNKERSGGRPAMTLPMDTVFDYFKKQKDKFYVHPEEGTIHIIHD